MTTGELWVDVVVTTVKFFMPVAAVMSLLLFLSPKTYLNLEKKLSLEFGNKKVGKKTMAMLEKENLMLQNMLVRNNRAVGLFCFIFSVILLIKLF